MAQTGRKTITQSFSFAPSTLNALRALAEANGTNLSAEMRVAVERHLLESRSADDVGDVKVTVKPKELPPDAWGSGPGDASIRHNQDFYDRRPRPELPKRAPRRYVIGAAVVVFDERPWSRAMLEQFEARLPTEVALLWAAEGERVLAMNGDLPMNDRPRLGFGMADPRKPEYGRESGRYR